MSRTLRSSDFEDKDLCEECGLQNTEVHQYGMNLCRKCVKLLKKTTVQYALDGDEDERY